MIYQKLSWLMFTVVSAVLCTLEEPPEVVVSRGAVIEVVPNVVLYTHEQHLNFLIPDLPQLPTMPIQNCSDQEDEDVCKVFSRLRNINTDSLQLLHLLSKFLTKSGLADFEVDNNVSIGLDGDEEPELPDGRSIPSYWYKNLKHRLLDRKYGLQNEGKRQRRWIATAVKTVTAGLALFGIDDAYSTAKSLFVDNDIIMKFLSNLKAYLPVSQQAFAEVSKRASEFEVSTRRLFKEVFNDTEAIRNTTLKISEDIAMHRVDLMSMQEGFTMFQDVLGDTTSVLFSSILYQLQLFAYQECRAHNIPMLYVPMKSMYDSLKDLAAGLDEDTSLAISYEQVQTYYTLQGMSNCYFDDNGGLLRVSVPLLPRTSTYVLYKVRPLEYAYEEETCFLDLEATFAVKDRLTGMVYTVTQVDEEFCRPQTTGLCRIPQSTSEDISKNCVALILSGAQAEAIKDGCNMKCVNHNKTEVAKISENMFVVTHPPKDGLEVVCPNERHLISEKPLHGSLQITLNCDCRMLLKNRDVARVTSNVCLPTDDVVVDVQIPLHFTRLSSFTPFSDEAVESITKFKDLQEIFDEQFHNDAFSMEYDGVFSFEVPIITVIRNTLQTLCIAYAFFRIHFLGAAVAPIAAVMRTVEGLEQQYTCRLPHDSYVLLILILIFACLGFIPSFCYCVLKTVRNLFWKTVRKEANKIQQMDIIERVI